MDPLFSDNNFNLAVTLMEIGKKTEAGKVLEECRLLCRPRIPPADRDRLNRLMAKPIWTSLDEFFSVKPRLKAILFYLSSVDTILTKSGHLLD
jgi:hypothetical protein